VTAACCDVEAATLAITVLPDTRSALPTCRAHYLGGLGGVDMSIAFPPMRPSLIGRRVGIRIVTFEACSGFTRVTARTRARPRRSFDPRRLGAACGSRHPRPESLNRPRATLSRGSNPAGYPTKLLASYRTNRQLSGWMESSSTDGSSLRGARPKGDIVRYTRPRNRRPFSESPIRSEHRCNRDRRRCK
jgi:hypothetical protein